MKLNVQRLDLNLLRVFDALMQEQNLSRAAVRLNLSQPAVSNALARLRRHLDEPLFLRTARGMQPTSRAQSLHIAVRQALHLLQQGLDPTAAFDLDRAWRLHPQVALRPEGFGALAYHFGTRRLTFLKRPEMRLVVEALAAHPSARAACLSAGLPEAALPGYAQALDTLARTDMIIERDTP